jgi:outer membrane protein assembly factor BamD
VLGYNYPSSPWYKYSYRILRQRDLEPVQDETSWISRALSAVF